MKGASGSVASHYTVAAVNYVYNEETKTVYDEELVLSSSNYDPQTAVSEQYDLNGGGFDIRKVGHEYAAVQTLLPGGI